MKYLLRVVFIVGLAFVVIAPHDKSDLPRFTVCGSYTTNDTMLINKVIRLDALLKDPYLWNEMQLRTKKEVYKLDTISRNFLPAYRPLYPYTYERRK